MADVDRLQAAKMWPLSESLLFHAEATAEEVAIVWRNCTTYNGPGSAMDKLRERAQKQFEDAWQRAQLPLAAPAGVQLHLLQGRGVL